jgi:hypothetical protein
MDEKMPLPVRRLGDVLIHIYEYPFEASIYLPEVERYEADCPCLVGSASVDGYPSHQECLGNEFKHWLNVAVVSDTCDSVPERTESFLIAEFNKDCQEGGWLWKMMDYQHEASS